MPIFRPGTHDEAIWRSVVLFNEYKLPIEFEPDDVIVDVGAHIGAFSYACLERGCGVAVAVEANRENFGLCVANLAPWGIRAMVSYLASWRSDAGRGTLLHFAASADPANTGGGNVMFNSEGCSVHACPMDYILCGFEKIRLLKLDCEGSEFPCLLTSKELQHVQEICGEFHECGGDFDANEIPERAAVPGIDAFTIEVLSDFLSSQGFAVEWQRSNYPNSTTPSNLGHFWARREHGTGG